MNDILTEAELKSQLDRLGTLRNAIAQAIVGQESVVEQLLIGLLAGGHCLLEGVPGLGKTLLVRSLGQALELQFRRVQFTPDLMPSDILGTELLEEDHGTGHRHFRFQPGPIFTNLLLADELNRTPPKTQAALLEAMQEAQVSADGASRPLPDPFLVLATQNPIERVRGPVEGHLALLHRLEERGLRLRRRAVDLVGEEHLGEHRPLAEGEVAGARVVGE